MNTWLIREKKRRDAYKLLSTCYFSPEGDAQDKLGELREILAVLCPPAAEQMVNDDTPVNDLKVDHARLFVGPYDLLAPPYGSVYLDGKGRRLIGDSTIDVERRYTEAGLGRGGSFKEAPDHIAIELEFLYYLAFKEVEAAANSDLETARDLLVTQQVFLRDHLGTWVGPFAEAVVESASTGYYRGLAGATRKFVRRDVDSIASVSLAELGVLARSG